MESDDESPEKTDRTPSPVLQRSQSAIQLSSNDKPTRTASPTRSESSAQPTVIDTSTDMMPPRSIFTFRSSHPFPQDADMSDLELSDNPRQQSRDGSVTSHASSQQSSTVTITRPARTHSRHNSHPPRLSNRSTNTLGRGAGQKRKVNLGEFFDLGNFGHGKDGFGSGGKRGRFT